MVERKEIEHIASLAKLRLGEDADRFVADVQAMIAMMDKLAELKLPMDDIPLDMGYVNTIREDIALPSVPRSVVLSNAPEVEAGCISVPKIMGKED